MFLAPGRLQRFGLMPRVSTAKDDLGHVSVKLVFDYFINGFAIQFFWKTHA